MWSQVGVHVSDAVDLRGDADCGTEYRPNFANSAPTLADVNGDGTREVVVVGNVYNCGTDPYTDLYDMPFILNADRSRWRGNGFDWTSIPAPDGAAAPSRAKITTSSKVWRPIPWLPIWTTMAIRKSSLLLTMAVCTLIGWTKPNTAIGPMPFTRPPKGSTALPPSPWAADLDNNGYAEVLFTSWTQKGSTAEANCIFWIIRQPAV